MSRVLGLDLGPNSIGWALVDDDDDPAKSGIINMGVRYFAEGVDAFDTGKEKSRNEDRRQARGMRRQIQRRSRRKQQLRDAIVEAGLWPADQTEQQRLMVELEPWSLRYRALKQRLTPFEIGRVLFHLNQRRGFLSNRKRDRGDSEVQGMLAEMDENEQRRLKEGHATIGDWLAKLHRDLDHTQRDPDEADRVRRRHLKREQLIQEFNYVWTAQAKHHPDLLTDKLKFGGLGQQEFPIKPVSRPNEKSRLEVFGIYGIIFFQRKMYWPRSVIGSCELEPKEKRCPRADRHAQLFRLLQEVNNLRYIDPDSGEELSLPEQHRLLLLDYLGTRETARFDAIRKKLGFLEGVKFNLERGQRASIHGMVTDARIAKSIGKDWHDRPGHEKDAIVRILLDNERDDREVTTRLIDEFAMDALQAEAALDVDFPTGYLALSLKAVDRLLPFLQQGMVYQSVTDPKVSALHAAGYLRRDELQRRLFDQLPDLTRVNPTDCKLGDIPNPVVKRALVELRKVVNAIVRTHGKPDEVHVELTRSLQMGAERRKAYNKRIREREAQRSEAAKEIRNMGSAVRREGIIRYLLWKEQAHECIYCRKTISQSQLFGGEIDIDHILPYSRSLDDSQMNKVVCHRRCNDTKGNMTPYEWLADTSHEDYERTCQQAGSLMRKGLLPYAKYRRFIQKEIELKKFIARQLTDTAYICRATVEYLKLLFAKHKEHAVLGLKGQLTAELRYQWGLNTILSELPGSPAWQEDADMRHGEKNRADLRHHAIDAFVVALTNSGRLQQLSGIAKRGGAKQHGEVLPYPWPSLRDDVKRKVESINVSHRVERRVRGALHEETRYGPTPTSGEWVVRKPLIDLSASEIERIRDSTIRNLVIQALRDNGIEFGRGKKVDKRKYKQVLSNMTMPKGVPIKKVRLNKPELTIRPLYADSQPHQTYVKPGSTHHLAIFEYEKGGKKKRDAIFVTMLEATERIKRNEPVIQRTPPKEHPTIPDDARFVMSLSSREMVLANWKGELLLLTYKTAASTQGQIYFALHTDGRRSSEQSKFVATANTLDAKKVTVDPLGRIRWAND